MIVTLQRSRRIQQALVVFLLLLAAAANTRAAGMTTAHWHQPRSSSTLTAPSAFAIGDLDGDGRPDLVSATPVTALRGSVRYSIRIQLSAGPWDTTELTAPAGALWIKLADISGNGALDVSVVQRPAGPALAVLLNDGHGNFSLSSPARWSEFVENPERSWRREDDSSVDGSILIRIPDRGTPETSGVFLSADLPHWTLPADSDPFVQPTAFFARDRAPPASRPSA